MYTAILKGFFLLFLREKGGGWQREARTDDQTNAVSIKGISFLICFILSLSVAVPNANALLTMDLSVGALTTAPKPDRANISLGGHLWLPIDQMIFIGAGGYYQEIDKTIFIPVTGSVWIRLPIGKQVLPLIIADYGYAVGSDHQFVWSAGLRIDIKNGDYSSLILMAGYQKLKKKDDYFYIRAGFLIEI